MRAIFKIEFEKYKSFITLIPTIVWKPKRYSYEYTYILDITWLTYHIGVGQWVKKK